MNAELAPQSATWEDYVGKAINDLKRRHPTLNLSQIAQRINLNRSTLNRIINEGIKPQLDNYIKIIVGSGNGNELSTALVAYDDSLVGDSNISELSSSRTFKATTELEKFLEDGDNYIVYMLSMKDNGTNIDEVIHVIGNRGSSIVDELLTLDLIEIDNTIIRAKNSSKIMLTSAVSIKKRLNKISQFYKTEHCKRQRNYIHTLTEGMNLEGIIKMQDLNQKFHQDMLKIMSAAENKGNIPMFSVAFTDSFTSINYDSRQELIQ